MGSLLHELVSSCVRSVLPTGEKDLCNAEQTECLLGAD